MYEYENLSSKNLAFAFLPKELEIRSSPDGKALKSTLLSTKEVGCTMSKCGSAINCITQHNPNTSIRYMYTQYVFISTTKTSSSGLGLTSHRMSSVALHQRAQFDLGIRHV